MRYGGGVAAGSSSGSSRQPVERIPRGWVIRRERDERSHARRMRVSRTAGVGGSVDQANREAAQWWRDVTASRVARHFSHPSSFRLPRAFLSSCLPPTPCDRRSGNCCGSW